jgi:hypothetical protein
MKSLIFLICGAAAVITVSAAFAGHFVNNQSTVVQSDINNMQENTSSYSTFTSNSSGYQRSTIDLSAANLSQPHMLKIETSATNLNGKIIVNGKVVQNLSNKTTRIDLSRYLSVGEHKIEIRANYTPKISPIKIELNAPKSNLIQQTSGNGILNYQLDVSVR